MAPRCNGATVRPFHEPLFIDARWLQLDPGAQFRRCSLPNVPVRTVSPNRGIESRPIEPGRAIEAVRAVIVRSPPATSPWITYPPDLFDVGVFNDRQPVRHG